MSQLIRRSIVAARGRLSVSARAACIPSLLFLVLLPARAQNTNTDLTSQSLEDLMKIDVISASKKSESLSKAPAAIFVITAEDITRGGFSSVPDALRMVPGLYVAQQSAHEWLVSARGFSNNFNDKMLVLIDGRIVYSTTFGGVYWDVQDPPLEDIDRIEVIRGPGGTLWGANAVNGVINIITKESAKTQGPQVSTSAGVNEGYAARVRYGGSAGENFAYRLYGTSNYWLPTVNAAAAENNDVWNISQGGARFDWTISPKDAITFDAEGYSGRIRDTSEIFSPVSPPAPVDYTTVVKGGHVLARWNHTYGERASTDVLGYCDWNDRVAVVNTDYRTTCDVELQHNYEISSRQTLTVGGGITTTQDTWPSTFTTSFSQPSDRYTTYSGLIQYDVTLIPDTLRVIAGSKFEHNSYTGFEYQPQIRAVWTPNHSNTIWAAVSRGVRTPPRVDEGVRERFAQVNPNPPPLTFILISGTPAAESEILHAYELGYRYEWGQKFSADAAVYYNGYGDLTGLGGPGAPIVNASPFFVDIPKVFENQERGQTHGLELSVRYVPVRRWTISTTITELRGNSTPATAFPAVANNTRQQVNAQSRLDLTRYLNFDSNWYHYNAIPGELPLLNRVDVGVSTNPFHGFTFSAWGRNLQQNHHLETVPLLYLSGEVRRSVVFRVLWEPNKSSTSTK